jgi:AraC family transcriptional regulator, transcriptional activator of pobA
MGAKLFSSNDIPQFALYGEKVFTHKPEFVHIEDICDRSSRHGWFIRPHRHFHLFQILYMCNGKAQVQLDERRSEHEGAWVITMPAGVVHGFRFHPDTQGIVFSLALNMLGLDAENQINPILEGILAKPLILKMHKNTAQDEFFQYLTLIRNEIINPREDQQIALYALVKMALLTLKRRLREEQFDEINLACGAQLTARFRTLLEQHYKEHWKIGVYADSLETSVSTLSRACQNMLGRSAKKLIQERLHIEAKRRLLYTQESLEEIAADLGFNDPTYFSKFFKQLEGTSPRQFRQSAIQENKLT